MPLPRVIVLAVIAAAVLCAFSVDSSYAVSARIFCGGAHTARDFLASLKAAPIQEAPETGELPFAQPAMNLEALGGGLIVGSDWFGFALTNEARGARKLGLTVESELTRVSARGRELASLQTKRRELGVLDSESPENFLHKVARTPAYYRVDIRFFRKDADRALAEYSVYARVMKPRVDLRVRIDTPVVSPGEMARATLLNLGTVPFVTPRYGYGFVVEAFTGQDWIFMPDNPQRLTPKRLGPWSLEPGTEDRTCLRYLVPSDQAPGLFRFVTYGTGAEPDIDMLAANFQVVPSG
jgi:hypothetical protein